MRVTGQCMRLRWGGREQGSATELRGLIEAAGSEEQSRSDSGRALVHGASGSSRLESEEAVHAGFIISLCITCCCPVPWRRSGR